MMGVGFGVLDCFLVLLGDDGWGWLCYCCFLWFGFDSGCCFGSVCLMSLGFAVASMVELFGTCGLLFGWSG